MDPPIFHPWVFLQALSLWILLVLLFGSLLMLLWTWALISTLHHIHKTLSFSSPKGTLWGIFVLAAPLLGVVLYRFFREKIEKLLKTPLQILK